MASTLVDLGKQLEIVLETGCWIVSEDGVNSPDRHKVILKGDINKIERTLELALIAVRKGKNNEL